MNLNFFPLLRRDPLAGSQSISTTNFNRSILASLLMAAAATLGQTETAAAIDLNFSTTTQARVNTNPFNFLFGPGVGNTGTAATTDNPNPNGNTPNGSTAATVVNYTNVATISPGVTIDARITATTFGAGYSFVEHIPNYSVNTAGQPTGDAAFLYQKAANETGIGGMNYKIDLFNGGGTFTTAYIAPALRFLVYDVDGESTTAAQTPPNTVIQTEAVRVFKNSGLVGYQVGNTPNALIPTQEINSYLFSGRNINRPENDPSGAAIFYFENTSSLTFQFLADTQLIVGTGNNPVFSAIDGDLSLLAGDFSGFSDRVGINNAATVPEPFTVIGTIIGGTAAFRMRKKLKSTNK